MSSMQKANSTNIYFFITAAVLIGLAGVFFRFLDQAFGHGFLFTSISNIILIIAILIALKGVFTILKA